MKIRGKKSRKLQKRTFQTGLLILFSFALLFSPFLTAFAQSADESEANDIEESNSSEKVSQAAENQGEEAENPGANTNMCEGFNGAVDLRAELSAPLDDYRENPIIMENNNVIPGSGLELDEDHIIKGDDWVATVTVDIDPDEETITIAANQGSDANDHQIVQVEITTNEIQSVDLMTDELFTELDILEYTVEGGVVTFLWDTGDAETLKDLTGESKFSYEPVPCPESTVTISYVDEAGDQIIDNESITGLIGDSYLVEAKEIAGYTLTDTPDNYEGEFKEENDSVIFVYARDVEPPACPLEEVDIYAGVRDLELHDNLQEYERLQVIPSVGPELTIADEKEDYQYTTLADFEVDINPDTKEITITSEDSRSLSEFYVEIESDQITSITELENTLAEGESYDFTYSIENGVIIIKWDDGHFRLGSNGKAVFSFEQMDCEEPPTLVCPLEEVDVYAGVRDLEVLDNLQKYERLQVIPSVGPELTNADGTKDYSYPLANFAVDIDPHTKEITITSENTGALAEFYVKIDSDQITSIEEIENTLVDGDLYDFDYSIQDGVILIKWDVGDGGYFNLVSGGKTVFSFEQTDCEEPEEPKEPIIDKDEPEPSDGKRLPETATPYFTFMSVGLLLLSLGGGSYLIYRKRQTP